MGAARGFVRVFKPTCDAEQDSSKALPAIGTVSEELRKPVVGRKGSEDGGVVLEVIDEPYNDVY